MKWRLHSEEEKFKFWFRYWAIVTGILFLLWIYKFFSAAIGLLKGTQDSTPFLALIIAYLVWQIILLRTDRKHKLTYNHGILYMIVSSLLTLTILCITLSRSKSADTIKVLSCNTILKDSTLFQMELPDNTREYVTIAPDSVDVTTMNCGEYTQAKWNLKSKLLSSADKILHLQGNNAVAYKLKPFLNDSDSGKSVMEDLKKDHFIYINDKVSQHDNNYYYVARLSVARDRYTAIDSLINCALAHICLGRSIRKLVTQPLERNPSVTVSFDTIIESFSCNCPDNIIVKEIKHTCGGNISCDSIYFIRGGYELNKASKLILESFFSELNKNTSDKFTVNFYGYTDATGVRSIPYLMNGSFTDPNRLLPGPDGSSFYLPGYLTNNDQLSFARAFSCYDFFKKNIGSKEISVHYTGGGIYQNASESVKQRTVKITISKNTK